MAWRRGGVKMASAAAWRNEEMAAYQSESVIAWRGVASISINGSEII